MIYGSYEMYLKVVCSWVSKKCPWQLPQQSDAKHPSSEMQMAKSWRSKGDIVFVLSFSISRLEAERVRHSATGSVCDCETECALVSIWLQESFYNSAITKLVVCTHIVVQMGSHFTRRVPFPSHKSCLDQRSRKVIVWFHRNHLHSYIQCENPVRHTHQCVLSLRRCWRMPWTHARTHTHTHTHVYSPTQVFSHSFRAQLENDGSLAFDSQHLSSNHTRVLIFTCFAHLPEASIASHVYSQDVQNKADCWSHRSSLVLGPQNELVER